MPELPVPTSVTQPDLSEHLTRQVIRRTADHDPIARLAATVMAEHDLLHSQPAQWCNESCRLAVRIIKADLDLDDE